MMPLITIDVIGGRAEQELRTLLDTVASWTVSRSVRTVPR